MSQLVVSQDEFASRASRLMREIEDLLVEKGKQYTDGGDALENFKAGAAMNGEPMEQYLMNLATKHWHFLCQWAAGRREDSPAAVVDERIRDIVVYMMLLSTMNDLHKRKEEVPF